MARPAKRSRKKRVKKWSAHVTQTSDALSLENEVFKKDDAAEIARSLKRSANKSHRRKGTPYQSAMSMLNFYINRAGKNLPEKRKAILENAKRELKKSLDVMKSENCSLKALQVCSVTVHNRLFA